VRFAFDGTEYEIDLSAKNAAAFGKVLAPHVEHARKPLTQAMYRYLHRPQVIARSAADADVRPSASDA
jgi:hypothetical protein